MTIRAVSFLLLVVAAAIFAQRTESVDPEATPPLPTDEGGHAILMQYVESRTTSITVNWTVNSTTTSSASSSNHDFQVLALSLNSGIVLIARPTNETEFTLTDLTVDTSYKICVVVFAAAAKTPRSSVVALANEILENSDPDRHHPHKSCLLASTIPYVRLDSILVFLGVVAFVALSIATAVFCWKRSQAEDPGSAAATDEDDHGHAAAGATAADDPGFEEKKRSDEEQPLLLDSDNNQCPPLQKNSEPAPEVKVESEVEPVVAGHQKSELPADGQADKSIPV